MVYYGTGISRGVAAGPIYCYEPFVPAPPCPAHGGSVEEQRALYEAAKQTAHVELSRMCARLEANKAAIFEAHMDILDDEVMDEEILAGIESEQWTAQWAVEQVYEHYRAVLGNAPDARIRERAADLSDVKLRLLRILQGAPARGLDSLERPVIVAAKELLPLTLPPWTGPMCWASSPRRAAPPAILPSLPEAGASPPCWAWRV